MWDHFPDELFNESYVYRQDTVRRNCYSVRARTYIAHVFYLEKITAAKVTAMCAQGSEIFNLIAQILPRR